MGILGIGNTSRRSSVKSDVSFPSIGWASPISWVDCILRHLPIIAPRRLLKFQPAFSQVQIHQYKELPFVPASPEWDSVIGSYWFTISNVTPILWLREYSSGIDQILGQKWGQYLQSSRNREFQSHDSESSQNSTIQVVDEKYQKTQKASKSALQFDCQALSERICCGLNVLFPP